MYHVGFMLAAMLLWFPLALHNLPVAANVDERNGLVVLARFHAGDPNPHFFFYPTLYYYLDYALTASMGYSRELLTGRLMNLALVGASAAASFFLVFTATYSRVAGWIVSAFILTSPVFAASGSYLDTDVLLAWCTAMSLAFLVRYFRTPTTMDWTLGLVLCGLAVSCKYTALVLYIAYLATELILSSSTTETWLARTRLPKQYLLGVALAATILLLAVTIWFPVDKCIAFIQTHRTNVNVKSPAAYRAFFHGLRKALSLMAAALLLLAALIGFSASFRTKISPVRLYLGLLIVLGVLLCTTPFSVVTPVRFIYDAGSLLKNNVDAQGGHAQWANYLRWFGASESWAIGALALAGLTLLLRKFREWAILYVYCGLYFATIGAASRGFPRYLLALLPALYCFSGYALLRLFTTRWGKWCAVVALCSAALWHGVHVVALRRSAAETDEAYRVYTTVTRLRPRSVFFAGNAPSEELKRAGYNVREISWSAAESAQFWQDRSCEHLVILDLHPSHPPDPIDVSTIQTYARTWRHVMGSSRPNTAEVYATAPCN